MSRPILKQERDGRFDLWFCVKGNQTYYKVNSDLCIKYGREFPKRCIEKIRVVIRGLEINTKTTVFQGERIVEETHKVIEKIEIINAISEEKLRDFCYEN